VDCWSARMLPLIAFRLSRPPLLHLCGRILPPCLKLSCWCTATHSGRLLLASIPGPKKCLRFTCMVGPCTRMQRGFGTSRLCCLCTIVSRVTFGGLCCAHVLVVGSYVL